MGLIRSILERTVPDATSHVGTGIVLNKSNKSQQDIFNLRLSVIMAHHMTRLYLNHSQNVETIYSQTVINEGNARVKQMASRINIENGIFAIQKIADGEDKVPNAMTRNDLTIYGGNKDISFYYGKIGNPKKNYKEGYGIAHIGSKHGAETLLRLPNVIANGKIERYVKGNETIVLTDGEYEVILALTWLGKKETWLLTGWKKDELTINDGKASAHSDMTQSNPTFSRKDLKKVIKEILK